MDRPNEAFWELGAWVDWVQYESVSGKIDDVEVHGGLNGSPMEASSSWRRAAEALSCPTTPVTGPSTRLNHQSWAVSRDLAGSEDWDLFEGKCSGREKKQLVWGDAWGSHLILDGQTGGFSHQSNFYATKMLTDFYVSLTNMKKYRKHGESSYTWSLTIQVVLRTSYVSIL